MAEVGIKVTEIPEKQTYKLTLSLPAAEYERLTARARKEGRSLRELLREALHWYIRIKNDQDEGWRLQEIHRDESDGVPIPRLLVLP